MTRYLRSAKDRESAILNDEPDTKFYFESQKPSDIPGYPKLGIENRYQMNDWGAQEVRKYSKRIEAAAARHSVDPNIVKAIIYTEAARGWYGFPAERADDVLHAIVPSRTDWLSHTIFPGNISPNWERLVPGSNVHNPKDNVELTTKLIAQIAKRLDDPSIENIYSLYNGLSHDRTYVNKDVKTTPLFARLAMEARAWEKDNWSAPELPTEAPPQAVPPGGNVSAALEAPVANDVVAERFGNWGSYPADGGPLPTPAPASFVDRFGNWGSSRQDEFGSPRSPVLRELQKYRRSATPDGSVTNSAGDPRATPPFPGDAVASSTDDISAEVPRAPATAAVSSPTSFMPPVPASEPLKGRSYVVAQNLPGLLDGGRESWRNSPSSAATALPSWLSGAMAPDLLGDEAQAPMNRALDHYLSGRVVGPLPRSGPNAAASDSAPQASFNERFGDWTSLSPRRLPRNSGRPMSTSEAAEPLGLVSGQSMPNDVSRLPIWGWPDAFTARGDRPDDWFNRWIRPLIEQ